MREIDWDYIGFSIVLIILTTSSFLIYGIYSWIGLILGMIGLYFLVKGIRGYK